MFGRFLGRARADAEVAMDLYRAIVAQARQPQLYRDLNVPDTVDGRFEMIVLHQVLLYHRLQREGKDGQSLAQAVFDLFVVDMDRSFREMGVGDFGVPKRMKAVGRSFYGRLEAYGKPITEGDRDGLAAALQRNLFPDEQSAPLAGSDLSAYVLGSAATLDALPFSDIAAGKLAFPDIAAEPTQHQETV